MQVLITGVGGFIGSHVAHRFLSEGHTVIGVDDFSTGKKENVPSGVELIVEDLSQSRILKQLPAHCDLILHLAGQSSGEISFDDPAGDLQKNTVSTLHLIKYGLQHKARKFLYASSMSVYGNTDDCSTTESHPCNPLSCYGVSKLAAERYLKVYSANLPYVILRMFNVYGPGQDMANLRQGMVSIFLAQALDTEKIHVKGSLTRYRDFIFISDVVEAWFRAATYPGAVNTILNVGTGTKTSIALLLESIKQFLPNVTWYSEGSTPGDQSGIYADTRLLHQKLNLNDFTLLQEGLKAFILWARENIHSNKTIPIT